MTREKETPKLFIDNAVSNNCKNLSESYGEICVRCNKCGRFEKAESENKGESELEKKASVTQLEGQYLDTGITQGIV